ncbi:islet cell autoantigen 1-like protein [Ruditapes philippinarum]|uniref:islet cell autoantigen 1-like protein n=1 Tax=Ruditapes philippinarum TaxID=129788 RepID=UPI00295B80CE|nr:islet cell autoantigen 1-like protein [Ruditapes philippinarum]
MSTHGYSGSQYDRFVERRETSTLHKFKETFWTTKQAVIQKLGKKEDEHVVASDSELDSKLEVFKAIQRSCMELLRAIEKYQDRLCALSMEENATGRFLKSNSGQDKTRAGKMMAAVGKSQSFAAQQRYILHTFQELQEPSQKLADNTREPAERDMGDDFDPENSDNEVSEHLEDFDGYLDDDTNDRLITLDEETEEEKAEENSSLHNLYTDKQGTVSPEDSKKGEGTSEPFLDFAEEVTESIKDLDINGKIPSLEKKPIPKNVPKDLMSDDLLVDDTEKDDMTILNEILNAPSAAGEDDFSREWQAVFGHTPLGTGASLTPGETDQSQNPSGFMPSDLLDLNQQMSDMNSSADKSQSGLSPSSAPESTQATKTENQSKQMGARPKTTKKGQKSDMSAWFNLFADLDPLADPDAVSKSAEQTNESCMG